MVVLALNGAVAKTLPVLRLATQNLTVSVDAVVRVNLLATTSTSLAHYFSLQSIIHHTRPIFLY